MERQLSPNTLKAYERDLSKLLSYCAEQGLNAWPELTSHLIRGFIAERHRQGLSSRSLQRELSACRSFFAYLIKIKVLLNNPAGGVRAPKAAKRLPNVLDVDQIHGLLEMEPAGPLETVS